MPTQAYREEDYKTVHEQILENMEVDLGELEETRKFYSDNPSALGLIKSKVNAIIKRAHKIRA